jgi:hypothetical protein
LRAKRCAVCLPVTGQAEVGEAVHLEKTKQSSSFGVVDVGGQRAILGTVA